MPEDDNEPRSAVEVIDGHCRALLESLDSIAETTSAELLYRRPPQITIGENILRSAACLEQVFGGLTANLWDDPFEWTLPEALSTTERIREYISEVDKVRGELFAHLRDEALLKLVSSPTGQQKTIMGLLLESLIASSDYRGRAIVTSRLFRL